MKLNEILELARAGYTVKDVMTLLSIKEQLETDPTKKDQKDEPKDPEPKPDPKPSEEDPLEQLKKLLEDN